MSGVACHYFLWVAQKVEQRQEWHDITALGLHARSNDVERGMPSTPLDSTHGRTTSVVAYIITFGQHTRWNYVGRGMPSLPLGSTKRSNDVGRGMPSSPLGSTHGRTTSGVACHNRLKAAHTVERRRAWHDIIAFGQHTRLNNVGRDMQSPHRTAHDRTKSGMA